MTENDDSDIDRAEDRELMSLFEQAAFAFEESAVPITSISRRFHQSKLS